MLKSLFQAREWSKEDTNYLLQPQLQGSLELATQIYDGKEYYYDCNGCS